MQCINFVYYSDKLQCLWSVRATWVPAEVFRGEKFSVCAVEVCGRTLCGEIIRI